MNWYELFSRHLTGIKKSGSKGDYIARCPFHSDKNPSFSFNEHTGLWQCFACGEKGNGYQFAERMGEELGKRRKEKRSLSIEELKEKYKIHRVYEYRDLDGNLLYKKHRFESPLEEGLKKKDFRIEWLSEERKTVLYRLETLKVINPEIIYMAEGEKCVEALNEALSEYVDNIAVLGFNSPKREFENCSCLEYFKGKEVVIFEDNDEAGKKKANEIVKILTGTARKISIVSFEGKDKGYDIADWIDEGNTLEDALYLADVVYEARYEDIDFANLLINGVPHREYIDLLWQLPRGILSLLAGVGSVGKGYFTIWNSLRWVKSGYNVCYITAEDDKEEIKRRILSLINKMDFDAENVKGKFRIYELSTENFLDVVKAQIEEGFEILIIDPIGFILEEENSNTQVALLMRNLQELCRSKQVNIILVHHLKKYGLKEAKTKFDMLDAVRGAGSLHNNARYVWMLRRSKEDDSAVEVYNCKNSYGSSSNDYLIENLLPTSEEKIEITPITLEDGKVKVEERGDVLEEKEDDDDIQF